MASNHTIDLADIVGLGRFIKECEERGIATRGQLRWLARWRHDNGLIQSGALIEKRVSKASKQPMLLVNRPLFAQWMAQSDVSMDDASQGEAA